MESKLCNENKIMQWNKITGWNHTGIVDQNKALFILFLLSNKASKIKHLILSVLSSKASKIKHLLCPFLLKHRWFLRNILSTMDYQPSGDDGIGNLSLSSFLFSSAEITTVSHDAKEVSVDEDPPVAPDWSSPFLPSVIASSPRCCLPESVS